ncbi:hypothetical protein AALT52_01220 [Ligilactobacillus faecis]|uniref:Replication initiation protein n=1 Tax=Ligilactobacillus faecis TaxID=762833 RepID=A0ABV4DMN3_9LACO
MSKKTITGNRFPYVLIDKLREDYSLRKISLSEGIVMLFCCNFADPDTGIVSWEGKTEKYEVLSANPTTNFYRAIGLVTELKRSATYSAVKNLLNLGYIRYNVEKNHYVVSAIEELSTLLRLPRNKQKKLSAEKREQLKYFRVPFYMFDTSLLSFIIASKKLSYLLSLLDMFKLISQHLGSFGDKRYFDDKALSLEFKIDDLKKMLQAPFSKSPVSAQTVTKVFIGYFSEICDSVLPFGETHLSGTFIKKIRFNFSKKIVNDIDIFARKEELTALSKHLSTTKKDDLILDTDYKIQLATHCFCDYNSEFWSSVLNDKKYKKLVYDLSIELKSSGIRDLRRNLFLKSAMTFDSYLSDLSPSINVNQNLLTSLAQKAIQQTVLGNLRGLAEREFANNIHDEYNALKYQLQQQATIEQVTQKNSIPEAQNSHLQRQWLALTNSRALLA